MSIVEMMLMLVVPWTGDRLTLPPVILSVTVTADVSNDRLVFPDPAQRFYETGDLMALGPGRPGAPVSIPGVPVETASGGIKAPQYFAPGVAGDHGEPIAQYLQVGSALIPYNLSANAHGNGYADLNSTIGAAIETVQVDGAAFNIREGNHAVNLAAVYGLHSHMEPMLGVSGDFRNVDLVAAWNPFGAGTRGWLAVETAYGNGLLDTPEHRRQYKLNGYRTFEKGSHAITVFGAGYYGRSRIPGLVPIDEPALHDTIDPRQRDETHTAQIVLNDVWHVNPDSELHFTGWFRTYSLALYSNFGDGLIRESEFRTGGGSSAEYIRKFSRRLSVLTGVEYLRDAPRRLDLDRYEPFRKVTANDVTLDTISPYVSAAGNLTRWLRYDAGWRRDEIHFSNRDLLTPANSFDRWVAVDSPKATLSFAREGSWLPGVAASFGQAFFTNDPRVGSGGLHGTPVSRAHSMQLVVSKTVLGTDLRVTLGRTTQEQSLAKIAADTGLQFNVGPSRNRFVTMSARRRFNRGFIEASFSRADARDLTDGSALPEAPRMIFDALGGLERLPFGLHARAEYEYVGAKPLGDGFTAVPVRELRGALVRPIWNRRADAGVNFLLASGYTGQTTEFDPFERIVGVRQRSNVSVSFKYSFGSK
jgi:hypothetical protein